MPKLANPESTDQFDKKNSYKLFDQIAKRYDFLNHFLSCGIDFYWRKRLSNLLFKLSTEPAAKLAILDLATGTGDLAILLGRHPRAKNVLGLDLSLEMIQKGKEKLAKLHLDSKIKLEQGDGVEIPRADSSYDAVTVAFGIRNFSDPLRSLENMHRVLKRGAPALILEFSLPSWSWGRRIYLLYLRHVLPIIGNLLSGHTHAYTYLNETIETFPYGNAFLELMQKAGFSDLQKYPLTFGIATLYVGRKE